MTLPLDDKIQMMSTTPDRRMVDRGEIDICSWHKAIKSLNNTSKESQLYRCVYSCDGKNQQCETYDTLGRLQDRMKMHKVEYEHLDGLA